MSIVLATQYMDTLKSIGADSKTNTIMLPHSAGGISSMMDQFRDIIIGSNQVVQATQPPKQPINRRASYCEDK